MINNGVDSVLVKCHGGMSDINTVDLRGFVDGEQIVGSVGFAGKAVGNVSIQVNEALVEFLLVPQAPPRIEQYGRKQPEIPRE